MGRLKLSANNDASPVRQASDITTGNVDLQRYVNAQEAALQSAALSTLQQASRGAVALQADIEGDTAMSLTPEESAKLNSTLEYCSTTAEVGERLIQSFANGGVQNPDLAVLKAQVESYADSAVTTHNDNTNAHGGKLQDATHSASGLMSAADKTVLDGIAAHTTFCVDCDTALEPGKYYTNANTLHAPESYNCIMVVEGHLENNNGFLWQLVTTDAIAGATRMRTWCRRLTLASGQITAATNWALQDLRPLYPERGVFQNIDGYNVLCPPAGIAERAQETSSYEFLRLYHARDFSRDPTNQSYGLISRFTNTASPTSGDANQSQLRFTDVCGGITAQAFIMGGYYKCASNVTYTDGSTEIVYGIYLKAGDKHNNKTVESVEYERTPTQAWFRFAEDNLATLGISSDRFAAVYAGSGSINTSDERLKQDIVEIPDEVLDAWGEVGWYQYKFNDSVAKKGDKARLHTGGIAQRILEVFQKHGLDATRYGLYCHDRWDDEYDNDENGVRRKVQDAGDRYSLRYEECLVVEAAYQRRRADRLEARIAALEAKLG